MLPTMRAALRPLLLALATTLPLPAAAQQYHAPTPWTGPPATATTTTRASGGRGGSRLGPYFAQDTGWRTAPPTTAVAPVTPAPGPVDVTPPADPAQRWTIAQLKRHAWVLDGLDAAQQQAFLHADCRPVTVDAHDVANAVTRVASLNVMVRVKMGASKWKRKALKTLENKRKLEDTVAAAALTIKEEDEDKDVPAADEGAQAPVKQTVKQQQEEEDDEEDNQRADRHPMAVDNQMADGDA